MSRNKLLKFMKNEIPKKKRKIEVLRLRKKEILELSNSGYSDYQIVDYLKKTYRIITSRQTVSKYKKEELRND